MAAKSQRPGARGTVGHPYSALNLRLALAAFGLVTCAVLAFLTGRAGHPAPAAVLGVLAVVAAVDLVVIQRRRRARRAEQPDGPRSLFE